MVKKIRIVFPLIMIVGLALSGCSGSQAAQTNAPAAPAAAAQTNTQSNSPAQATPGAGGQNAPQGSYATMADQNQLAAGTLKLDGTGQAVTAEQAKTLLPLWQEVKTQLADTNTTSDQLQAAYQKIKDSMTSDQVQAIEKMSLTQDDLQSLASQYGVQMTGGPGGGQGNGPSGTPGAGGGPGGNPPAQGTPGAGGNPPAQGTPGAGGNPPDFQGTPGAGGRMGRGMDSLFLDPLIKLLQERAGA